MPILYRFFSAKNAMLSIESKRLRVGRIAELNDPFDCALQIVGESSEECANAEVVMERLLADRNRDLGVFCFTKTWSEPVLWSHYANHHRGIALVFEFEEGREDLYPMRYDTERPKIAYKVLREQVRARGTPDAFLRSMTVKSKAWQYEDETRIIVALPECTIDGGSYFQPFGSDLFRGVILGLRCTAIVADVRRTCRQADFPDVRIWRAVKSPTGFSLDREEV